MSEKKLGDGEPSPPPQDWAEKWAKDFHDTYERTAPKLGYETRKESAKPWAEVPENNRKLMIAVCAEVLCRFEKWRSGAAQEVSPRIISRETFPELGGETTVEVFEEVSLPSPPQELFDRFPSMDANALIQIYSVAHKMASGDTRELKAALKEALWVMNTDNRTGWRPLREAIELAERLLGLGSLKE